MSTLTRADCVELDAADPLRDLRELFDVDDSLVYLDGNSLGRPPRATRSRIDELIDDEWARRLIAGWFESGWMDMPLRTGAVIAQLIGADADEVVVADSTSMCLYKLLVAALRARPGRRVLLTEQENFPTDVHVVAGVANLLADIEVRLVERARLLEAIDESVAVVTLTHVDYRTAAMHDMATVTAAAHAAGALIVWDLSHSAGAVSVDVHGADVDMATGCGYKYLNGGPGAPAYIHVARRLQDQVTNPFIGWLGHAEPFTFDIEHRAATGMRGWITGTPPVPAIAALDVAVRILVDAGVERLDAKSRSLTECFIRLADEQLAGGDVEVITPRGPGRRGAQVSLRHEGADELIRRLAQRGVVGDFRAPDCCRFGLAPAYTRHVDLWDAVQGLRAVLG